MRLFAGWSAGNRRATRRAQRNIPDPRSDEPPITGTAMPRLPALALAAFALLAGPAQAADKLTVMLDWFVNPDHGPLFVALERGEYARRGLEVELLAPAAPHDPPQLLAAGPPHAAIPPPPHT